MRLCSDSMGARVLVRIKTKINVLMRKRAVRKTRNEGETNRGDVNNNRTKTR